MIIRIITLIWFSLTFFLLQGISQIRFCSWNIANLGKSKDQASLSYISSTLKNFDLIAIQEVNTGTDGIRAIKIIDSLLELNGSSWDFAVSEPTSGKGSERYAYLWNTKKIKLCGFPWLNQELADSMDREPYLGRFALKKDTFLIANLHAVPTAKNPAREIAQLHRIYELHKKERLIYAGDFNLTFTHKAYDSLRTRTYLDAINDIKTSLKTEIRENEKFANSYDHILYPADRVSSNAGGIIDITLDFESLKACRKISDHVPIWAVLQKNKKWKRPKD
ncbi:MAG: endonuclease/exonuclease/phosphatase family protein [Flavobacteriales bacterium]|nr:endonuclease/exonuclease/phosphatase family protein [Flavobacteriales bacterium]